MGTPNKNRSGADYTLPRFGPGLGAECATYDFQRRVMSKIAKSPVRQVRP